MSKASRLDTLKFDAGIEQALVLRPTGTSSAQRLPLADCQARRFFRANVYVRGGEGLEVMSYQLLRDGTPLIYALEVVLLLRTAAR